MEALVAGKRGEFGLRPPPPEHRAFHDEIVAARAAAVAAAAAVAGKRLTAAARAEAGAGLALDPTADPIWADLALEAIPPTPPGFDYALVYSVEPELAPALEATLESRELERAIEADMVCRGYRYKLDAALRSHFAAVAEASKRAMRLDADLADGCLLGDAGDGADLADDGDPYAQKGKRGKGGRRAGYLLDDFAELGDADAAHSYRRVHPDLPLAVLTDYDAAWPSDAGTPTDGLDRLDVRALAVAAELVARAAHAWASSGGGDGDDTPGLSVDADSLERDVAQLLACFGPQGLACPLAAAVLRGGAGPRAGPPSSYVGILRSLTKDSQASDPLVKGARERFLLGYLAYAAAGIRPEAEGYVPRGRPCSAASELQCPGGGVCVGAQTQDRQAWGVLRVRAALQAGLRFRSSECLNVTAKYVPAYPTALECRACDGQRAGGEGWHFTEAAATWEASFGWPEEDVWAESNWPTGTPSLSLLLRESAARERQVLLAGVGVALLCVAGVALLQKQARGWLPGAAGGDG
ncbi:hypothetical protein APUTEX25_000564 [Auxenochlorella protothecoides]|uniref:Uncharacterized protein n=1 Tax=Auxenochlorella protothecoides TaxID=3075 RepID=A0A3M7L2V1_AUXPR|nr:hypothetical protein APUTEX25_000564 [Auxenochlorella protothecoides]|eukprot:RMZ56325.1 hypothetical protein APUTEX25_000564 [Auxenochlorella protothecoides]